MVATLGPIDDPLIATAIAGVISALACAALLAASTRLTPRLPTIAALAAAAAATAPLAEMPPSRFLRGEEWAYPAATVVALAAGLALFTVSAFQARLDNERSRWATVGLAALAMGAFVCIPETGLLRLAPGPLCVVALAAVLGWAKPFDPLSTALLAALISWLGITGGTGRPTSLLGVACALALGSIAPSLPAPRLTRRRSATGPASAAGATVLGARVVGTIPSSAATLFITSVALLLAAAALLDGRASSEQLQGSERQ